MGEKKVFGEWGERVYRLFFNVFATITILPVIALPNFLPDHPMYSVGVPWRYLLMTVQMVSGVILIIGVFQTGIWSFIGLRQLFKGESYDERMVATGLYHCVRHPLYTAVLFLLWASPDMTVNGLALKLELSLYLIIGAYIEEGKLLKVFGDYYLKYRKKTPMFFPKGFCDKNLS